MPRKRKAWSKVIEEAGIRVRVFERAPGALLYREVRDAAGEKDRKSLGHRDRALAEQQARALARRLAELRFAGHLGAVTLGQVFRLYFTHRAPLLSERRRRDVRVTSELFLAHFGDGFAVDDFSQTHLDGYLAARRTGALRPDRQRTKGQGVREGTLHNDVYWLRSVFAWARGFRVGGRRLLGVDPLEGVRAPQERNPRRPVASVERYERTLAKADQADPRGRLRCMLALARYTGRRINAITQLRASDVLLTREQMLGALAAMGLDERQADFMPHGAVRWRAEFDKRGYDELTALAPAARAALDAYLRAHPAVGEGPLFPASTAPEKSAGKMMAVYWLRRAERLAGLPKLERGLWHAYRRLWASERRHLPDVDVAKAGGWRNVQTLKKAYQHADAAMVLRVVENEAPGLTSDSPRRASDDAASA